MAKDYVSRPKPNNNKKSPYKKQPQSSGLTVKAKIITLITLIALAGFAYGLWFITNQEAPKPTTEKSPATVKNKTSRETDKKVALPAPPKEVWRYRKDLETKEVEVGEYEVKNKGPYQMQCGSFKSREQAEVLKAKIAFSGLEATIRKTTGKNGVYHKVILGPYARKRLAESDKHKLKRNQINYCQIWLWR